MRYAIKELSLGGILDQAVALMKNHFKMLFCIMLFVYLPYVLLQGIVLLMVQPDPALLAANPALASRHFTSTLVASVILTFGLLVVVMPLTNAALIQAIADEYLGYSTTAKESMRSALSFWPRLLWAGLLKGLIIYVGLACCIIPGIYLLFRYYFVDYAVVLEGATGMQALGRSKELMKQKGNLDKAFLLGLLLFIVGLAGGVVARFVPTTVLKVLVQAGVSSVCVLFGMTATVVFYFSSRCKLENFDLRLLAEAVGRSETEPPAGKTDETV